MVANCDRSCLRARRILIAASAFALGFSLSAAAQTSSTSQISADGQSYSSSREYLASLDPDALPRTGTPAVASAALAGPSPQYGGGRSNYPSYPNYESRWSHLAFLAGGGFTTPVGNATHGYETWGYNFDVGAGWNFSKRLGVLFEYDFNKNKIPGATIALVGAQGGNINTHLFMFNPIYYFMARRTTGAYVLGGVGFSRKVTNFTNLVQTTQCYYYFCGYGYAPVTVAHFSSNQFAADGGLGLYWKAFGPDSKAKLFAEARYVFVDSPKPTQSQNGEGTEGLIPVTFGIRF